MAVPVMGWHFLPADRRTRYSGDPVEIGKALEVAPPLVLCKRGLHASRRAIDALQYSPGPIACRVKLSGEIVEGNGKLCASRRVVVAWCDATTLLHTFACDVADEALRVAGVIDERSHAAIAVKRRWIKGEAAYTELSAAWDAAWDAASAAAWDAARDAASAAAMAAARDAASAAAMAAARAAANAAAWDAAWAAARAAASAAAWAAAWAAARDAARDAQNSKLETMLLASCGLEVK